MRWMYVLLLLIAACTVTTGTDIPSETNMTQNTTEVITLAAGCFWCTEGLYQETPGVIDAVSGFAGGTSPDPTYNEVASGSTDYREAVQITYNPDNISTKEILDLFWRSIDPTDDGGQFVDRGEQYTTAIYYHDEGQKQAAEQTKQELIDSGRFDEPVVTEILPYTTFYEAEEYHQDFYKKSQQRYQRYKDGSGRNEFTDQNWD